MKVRLLYPDRDWDQEPLLTESFRWFRRTPLPPLPPAERAALQDLDLDTVCAAMAEGDEFLLEVARRALLDTAGNDPDVIRRRQAILRDCLAHPSVARDLYAAAVDAVTTKRGSYVGIGNRHPGSRLYDAVDQLRAFLGVLRRVRGIADAHAGVVESEGLRVLVATLQEELTDRFLIEAEAHVVELGFRRGVLLSGGLGPGGRGAAYLVRRPAGEGSSGWLRRLVGQAPSAHTFHIDERDEAGARALGDIRAQGIAVVAEVAAQSADHIRSFFELLRAELGFYVGCLNLQQRLTACGAVTVFPVPAPAGSRRWRCRGLYDPSLALRLGRAAVANDVSADGRSLVVVTGANQGGKSTFLRSVGLAQLMMQAGMPVTAAEFAAESGAEVFTHFKQEEDRTQTHGKLDEELARFSGIVDRLRPNDLVLLNESFAATDEREGSEIADQVVRGLVESGIRIVFVTHLYTFAQGAFARRSPDALFLRAERRPDGTRTFKLAEAGPVETTHAEDLYREVFGDAAGSGST